MAIANALSRFGRLREGVGVFKSNLQGSASLLTVCIAPVTAARFGVIKQTHSLRSQSTYFIGARTSYSISPFGVFTAYHRSRF